MPSQPKVKMVTKEIEDMAKQFSRSLAMSAEAMAGLSDIEAANKLVLAGKDIVHTIIEMADWKANTETLHMFDVLQREMPNIALRSEAKMVKQFGPINRNVIEYITDCVMQVLNGYHNLCMKNKSYQPFAHIMFDTAKYFADRYNDNSMASKVLKEINQKRTTLAKAAN